MQNSPAGQRRSPARWAGSSPSPRPYPDLKANQNMMQLSEELTSTENKVAFSRQAYNDSVMTYNTAARRSRQHLSRACSTSRRRRYSRSRRSTPRRGKRRRSSSEPSAVMNFFEHQRRQGTTLRLVALFVSPWWPLVAAIDRAVVIAIAYEDVETGDLGLLIVVTVVTAPIIGVAHALQDARAAAGRCGRRRSLGGRPGHPTTTDPSRGGCVNIVEEMALASGVPVPRVFVLPQSRASTPSPRASPRPTRRSR